MPSMIVDLTPGEQELSAEVRSFLSTNLPRGTFEPGLGMASPSSPAFSALLGKRGWIGMAVPAEYGGAGATAVARFLVAEQLLRWGAPVGYHWVADRQIAPMLVRYGAEHQKRSLLPRICAGTLSFCIGMSEPGAGSDLAAVATRASRVSGGWRISGTKVWTSFAHTADYMITLCRTGDQTRHANLSRFLVDMRTPGVTVTPITYLDGGTDHFSQIHLEDVFVADDQLIGDVGQGWAQNTEELAFERSGPDRWISSFLLVEELMRAEPELAASARARRMIAEFVSRYWVLRRLSLGVARAIDAGDTPSAMAALIKEMSARFEQEVVAGIADLTDRELLTPIDAPDRSLFKRLLHRAILDAPSYTIRGGTTEIMRSVAAKGLS